MKYLYPYECEKRGLSNPNELQAAIDSNRREGRRQSFGGSLFAYSPGGAHSMLSSPKLPVSSLGLATSTNGSSITPAPKIKKGKDLHGARGTFPAEFPGGLTSGNTSSSLWVTRTGNPVVDVENSFQLEKRFQSTSPLPMADITSLWPFSNSAQEAGRHC
ncbi:AT-rich interactive domain-containing protein 3A [Plecturocebus cupreus]